MSWSSISKCSSFTRRRCSSRYDIPPWRVEQLHCRDFNSLISPGASDMGQILKGSMWDPFCTVAKCLQLEGGERCMWFLKKWFKNQKITAYGKIRHFFMKIRHFFTFFSLHVFCFFLFFSIRAGFFTIFHAQNCSNLQNCCQIMATVPSHWAHSHLGRYCFTSGGKLASVLPYKYWQTSAI